MNIPFLKRLVGRDRPVPRWIWEVLLIATVMPPLVHAVASLDALSLA